MTTVNVTTNKNTISVNETTNTITVTKGDATIVEVATEGPQGPKGDAGNFTLSDTNKVNKSIIYYDSTAGTYKADSTWTTNTITDGGNF